MKPKHLKPKTKHKKICVPVKIESQLRSAIVYTYLDLLSEELYIPTLKYNFYLTLYVLISLGVCCIIASDPHFSLMTQILLFMFWLLTCIYACIKYWHFTAEYVVNNVKKIPLENIECHAITLDKKYINNFDESIICVDNIKLKISKSMYKLCRAEGTILIYSSNDKVLFWHPTTYMKRLNITLHSFDDICYKIRLKDTLNYYKVCIRCMFEIFIIATKEIKEYIIDIINSIKRR